MMDDIEWCSLAAYSSLLSIFLHIAASIDHCLHSLFKNSFLSLLPATNLHPHQLSPFTLSPTHPCLPVLQVPERYPIWSMVNWALNNPKVGDQPPCLGCDLS